MFSFQSKVQSKRELLLLSDSLLVEQLISKVSVCLILTVQSHTHTWWFWSFNKCFCLPVLQRKQNQVPCRILALPLHTDLKAGRKLQYYFFPCPLLLLLMATARAHPVRFCAPSAPMGVPGKNKYFHKGYLNCGQSQAPSSPSPNTGGRTQREASEGKVLLAGRVSWTDLRTGLSRTFSVMP